jgi:periplasmic protein TonB
MHEAVSDILVDRARDAGGLSRMVMLSAVAHAVAIALVVFLPPGWLSASADPERPMMMISIAGGAPGPDITGETPIAGRPIQQIAPPDTKAADTPPARETPEMVEPAERPAPKPKPVEKPAEKSTARKPTTGKEIAEGAARVDTGGAQVPFGGLATGGGAVGGQAYTDYANFCCPSYLDTMVQVIRRNWNQRQGASGMVLMKFTILRDGRITNIEHEKPSGTYLLDIESQRALAKTRLPPLPREFPEDSLTVHLYFQYQR